ncbi:hypothetical protein DPMN_070293 [Dreissena polymorpha]|uniref:Uncharacterized protein n=1 Tax=Dreissena polymorpha TaxID=45954 RepID=A0A9D3Z0I3_DREPO|nr:hypothetical protein DPMN_070293 [Dreissena polymorpha]
MYDPMGMLSPVAVCAKILVQNPWKNGYDWNTSLTVDIVDIWSSISSDLNIALNSSFQRIYLTSQTTNDKNHQPISLGYVVIVHDDFKPILQWTLLW